jgi:hypothetical protein
MYAIIQEIDGYITVGGKGSRLYDDLTEATTDWEEVALVWYEEFGKVCKGMDAAAFRPWTENPPKLMDLTTKNVIYPTSDKRIDFLRLYEEHQSTQECIQTDSIYKSKTIKKGYENSIKALLRK